MVQCAVYWRASVINASASALLSTGMWKSFREPRRSGLCNHGQPVVSCVKSGMGDLRLIRGFTFAVLVALGTVAPTHGRPVPAAPITWLVFVDDVHIDFRDTGYLRTLLKSIAADLIRDGDEFAVRSSGPSSVSIAFGSDRALLDAAIPKLAGAELYPPDAVSPEAVDELRYRANVAGITAVELLSILPKPPVGRPALLYISDGYARTPTDPVVAFAQMARQLGVTVFALNPHGLRRVPQVTRNGSPDISAHDRDVMLKSLRAIAEPSGGFAVLGEADFADALQRIGHIMR